MTGPSRAQRFTPQPLTCLKTQPSTRSLSCLKRKVKSLFLPTATRPACSDNSGTRVLACCIFGTIITRHKMFGMPPRTAALPASDLSRKRQRRVYSIIVGVHSVYVRECTRHLSAYSRVSIQEIRSPQVFNCPAFSQRPLILRKRSLCASLRMKRSTGPSRPVTKTDPHKVVRPRFALSCSTHLVGGESIWKARRVDG